MHSAESTCRHCLFMSTGVPVPSFPHVFHSIRPLKKQVGHGKLPLSPCDITASPKSGQPQLKISARWLLRIPRSLALEYSDCPESVSLPLGGTHSSHLCLNGPGGREPRQSLFPSHEQLGGGELRRGGPHGEEGFVVPPLLPPSSKP